MIRSVRLDEETNELLERVAGEAGVTPSQFIRDSLRRTIRASRKDGGGSFSARIKALIGSAGKSGSGGRGRSGRRTRLARNSASVYGDLLLEKHERRQRRAKGKAQ